MGFISARFVVDFANTSKDLLSPKIYFPPVAFLVWSVWQRRHSIWPCCWFIPSVYFGKVSGPWHSTQWTISFDGVHFAGFHLPSKYSLR